MNKAIQDNKLSNTKEADDSIKLLHSLYVSGRLFNGDKELYERKYLKPNTKTNNATKK